MSKVDVTVEDLVEITVDGHHLRGARRASSEVATRLGREGVFVSNGDFYAATVVERLGLAADGLVRAGCACYTTAEEVDRLVDGVSRLAS